MAKEESGAFRIKVKVKEAPPRKAKPRKAPRKAAAPKMPPHRSLMEALKQVAPPQPQEPAQPIAQPAGQQSVERPVAPAAGTVTPPDPAATAAPTPDAKRGETGTSGTGNPRAGFVVPPVEVEEAEVEIVYLDPRARRRRER